MAAPSGVGQGVQSSASGVLGSVMRARARFRLATLPVLAPVIFAVPVVSGIVATLANLAGTSDPYLGLSTTATNVDAQAVFLGEPLYGDPNEEYSGLPLSPLFPLLLGALHHISLWSGWGILLSTTAAVCLAAIAGGLGYRSAVSAGAARGAAAAGAVGIGALAWWLITFVTIDFLHEARADQPAWALALGGLVLVPAALDGSSRAAAAAVLMLTAAAWTKQPAGAAMAAAALWTVIEVLRGHIAWRRAALFVGALAVVNGAVLALAVALTSGWAFTFIVEIPARETREQGLVPSTRELLTSTAGAALFAASVWAAYVLACRRLPSGRQAQIAGALAVFIAVGSLTAVVANTKQGSLDNQFIGVTWALALFGAIGWGEGVARRGPAAAGAALVVALFALAHADGLRSSLADTSDVDVPPGRNVTDWVSVSHGLRELASSQSVYHPVFSDLNVEPRDEVFPSQVHIRDVLAGGERPGFLVGALLDRRFDVVFQFDEAERFELSASAYGEREENFLWKLNRVISARYAPEAELPRGVRSARLVPDGSYASPGVGVRRPGREHARWMRDCFGPFRIASETWQIRRGGGFWCRPGGRGPVLRLRETPAAVSELRSASGVERIAGRLTIVLPRRQGVVELACTRGEQPWLLRARGARDATEVELLAGDTRVRRVPGPRVTLALAASREARLGRRAGAVAVVLPGGDCGALSVRASRHSDVRVRLDGLRLH
jgi:hypothetical protein